MRYWIALLGLLLSLSPVVAQNSDKLVLLTHDSFNVSDAVLSKFEGFWCADRKPSHPSW